MTQEEKQLLLKDLSARLPYNVKCRVIWDDTSDRILTPVELFGFEMNAISEIKPYLRPMSSMTEEEKQEYYDLTHQENDDIWAKCLFDKMADFCNERHLDYRGLIEKGLALEAPEDMYKTE